MSVNSAERGRPLESIFPKTMLGIAYEQIAQTEQGLQTAGYAQAFTQRVPTRREAIVPPVYHRVCHCANGRSADLDPARAGPAAPAQEALRAQDGPAQLLDDGWVIA